ncbi:MAG: hypothetical protein ABJ037_18950 [Paracoccaceae bacterium]
MKKVFVGCKAFAAHWIDQRRCPETEFRMTGQPAFAIPTILHRVVLG